MTARIAHAVLICLAGCASLGSLNPMRPLEQKLVFHPTQSQILPGGGDFESVRISSDGGSKIHGVFLEHPAPQAVLLYCHGNAGNIVDRLPRLRELRAEHDITVLGFDYRGYGASAGRPSEAGLYTDARAARRWLAQRCGIGEREVVILGRSLGGAVAVELASADGARGLILESTFTSIPDVGKSHLRWLPVSLLVSQKFDSINKIANYDGPLLQTHGSRDEVVPFELGQRLHDQAQTPGKSFVITAGGHNERPPAEYTERLARFLGSLSDVSEEDAHATTR